MTCPRCTSLLLLTVLALPVPLVGQADAPGRSTVYAPNAAAATSQPLATSAALRVMQRGGNAFDAAVAAAAVLNVVEPHMTGMGGDLFALFWSADEGRLVGLDASGKAGSGMDADRLRSDGHERMPRTGAASVTVPGALSGWVALLEGYGTPTLGEALASATEFARDGFPVTPIIASQWQGQVDKLKRDEGAAATYLIGGARAPEAGEWVTNPDLANTLETLARDGAGSFYGGALGRRIADGLAELGGTVTIEDLRAHEPRWVEPISVEFRGHTIWELPPSGQGVAALQMLGILEPMDLESMGPNSADLLHVLIETKKLAYEDLRRYVADPEWMTTSVDELLAPEYLDERRALLSTGRAAVLPDPEPAAQASETIYLSVADPHGNMVSLINSLSGSFGSGVVVPGTGVMLQNRGAGFTLEEGHPNRAAPGKRPFHTIIPGFVTKDGEPLVAFGLMGGSMQPQGHAQLLINLLAFDMDPQAAIDAPRFRHLSATRVAIEHGIDPAALDALAARGHEVIDPEPVSFGGAQLVWRLTKGWAAASDPRKDGHAAGY